MVPHFLQNATLVDCLARLCDRLVASCVFVFSVERARSTCKPFSALVLLRTPLSHNRTNAVFSSGLGLQVGNLRDSTGSLFVC